ncbi:MAG: hypothetical protein HYX55_06345 [Chloroflexi bacterium]|nr:hypothetical protein [Chloroflexota bacterium]
MPPRRTVLVALAVAALAVGIAATAAVADDLTQTFDVGVAACDNAPPAQLCTPVAKVSVTTQGTLRVAFTAAATHCSPIIAHLLVDGVEKFVSAQLGPGETTPTQDFGPVTAGDHVLGVQGEGVVGGCNAGATSSWGGTLAVAVSGAPTVTPTPPAESVVPRPTPAPGNLGTGTGADYTPLLAGFAGLVIVGGGALWSLTQRRAKVPISRTSPESIAFPPDPVAPPDSIDRGGTPGR